MRPVDTVRLHNIWRLMLARINDPNVEKYPRYGGRGITVCDEWLDFDTFHEWAVSSGYASDLTIDRTNNDGNYEPSNCRWATPTEQARNRSSTRFLTAWGETKCLAEWAEDERCVVGYHSMFGRLQKGWTPEDCLSVPARSRNFRGGKPPRWPEQKTHCPQGHAYDEANTRLTNKGHRVCRACKRVRANLAYHEGRWKR